MIVLTLMTYIWGCELRSVSVMNDAPDGSALYLGNIQSKFLCQTRVSLLLELVSELISLRIEPSTCNLPRRLLYH